MDRAPQILERFQIVRTDVLSGVVKTKTVRSVCGLYEVKDLEDQGRMVELTEKKTLTTSVAVMSGAGGAFFC